MILPVHVTFDIPPATQTTFSMEDGVAIVQIVIPQAGTYVPQHSHTYAHTSMLAVGKMRVWAGDECLGDFAAPRAVKIEAGVKHTMMALTNGVVWYCIHNIDRTGVVEELEHHEFSHA